MMYARAALKAMLSETPVRATIPSELMTTNRILERWAVSIGAGLPSEEWDDNPRAQPTPLDDHSSVIVDRLVMCSPPKTKNLLFAWYKTPAPTEVIAERLKISPRSVNNALRVTLHYMKWKIEGTKHADLLRILRIHV